MNASFQKAWGMGGITKGALCKNGVFDGVCLLLPLEMGNDGKTDGDGRALAHGGDDVAVHGNGGALQQRPLQPILKAGVADRFFAFKQSLKPQNVGGAQMAATRPP